MRNRNQSHGWLMVCIFALGLFISLGIPDIAGQRATNGTVVGVEPDPTNAPPAFDPGTAPLPKTKEEFWQWGMAIATVLIVWGFGKIPQLPRPVLPLLTPIIGVALGAATDSITNANLSWVDNAQIGALAVFIRESVNQLVTKQLKPLEDSKTNTKPVDKAVAVSEDSAAASSTLNKNL